MERTVRPKYICYLNNVGAEVHPYNENGALGICILQQAANPSWLPAQALHPQANILATAVDHGNITGICIFELYNVTLSWLSCTRRYMLDLWLIYNEKKKSLSSKYLIIPELNKSLINHFCSRQRFTYSICSLLYMILGNWFQVHCTF